MYSNWSYSPETPNLGQIWRFLEPCDLEIWRMTLKNNRAPLLCCFQLCAWFHCHMWIQTGVRVRKRLSWVLTSVTLTFDLWPSPFAWTSLLTMVITPENFMMIRWWEHGEKGVTDRRTDGRTDRRTDGLNQSYSCLVAAKKPGGHLNIKMSSYQYRDSHVKDKTVSPTALSLTWESPYLGRMVFILRWGPVCWPSCYLCDTCMLEPIPTSK